MGQQETMPFKMGRRGKNMIGLKFSRLLVIEFGGFEPQGQFKWKCRCDCGVETIVTGRNLRKNHTTSCGCYNLERTTRHGQGKKNQSPEYVCWHSMLQRCQNKNSNAYKAYGGAGISVCKEWEDFVEFFKDMGERPSPNHSLDRWPDMNGNYEKSNCRWGTTGEQARNKKNNFWVEVDGERMVATDWGAKMGVNPQTITNRIRKGFKAEDAVKKLSLKDIYQIKDKINKNTYYV